MSYIFYIGFCILSALSYVLGTGNGNGSWLDIIIFVAVIVFVFGIFFLCAFLLNTKHNGLYAALITIGAVVVVVIFFIILECFTGPVELPSR